MNAYRMRVSAKGLFFNSKGEVLLIRGKRDEKAEEYWSAPGGGVEEDENLFLAVEREILEETGYRGRAEKIVFVQDYSNPDHGRNLEIFITGMLFEDTKIDAIEDLECRFVNQNEFRTLEFLPSGIDPFLLRQANKADYKTYL